jgi:hypothetical protein
MEIDLTAVADEVAAKIWDARLMMSGEKPYAELELGHQNAIKEQILPVLFYTLPIVEKAVKDKIDREIMWNSNANNCEEAQANLNSIRDEIKNL